jgi:hypothetical protein
MDLQITIQELQFQKQRLERTIAELEQLQTVTAAVGWQCRRNGVAESRWGRKSVRMSHDA